MSSSAIDLTLTAIDRVAILGAGTMGHGIAQICAMAGLTTRLYDSDPAALERGLHGVLAQVDRAVDRGKATSEQRELVRSRLAGAVTLAEATADADLVIEAVPERLALKQEVLARAAAHARPDAVLATNTSALSIDAIAEALPSPERVIGTHFFNPVPIMKLLEIVVGSRTEAAVVARVERLATLLGKETIRIRDSPGFATSRLGLVIGLEAIRMVEEGVASVEDIDRAMTLGYGFPMGPLRLTDLVGLDVRLRIAEHLSEHLPNADHFRPPALLRRMVAEGKLGKKSGQGFYAWG